MTPTYSRLICCLLALVSSVQMSWAQSQLDSLIPVRGLCISAPKSPDVERFLRFIDEELGPKHINTLVLRFGYNYAYESFPELRDSLPLTRDQVKQIADLCKSYEINLIPMINLLGHQSWAEKTGRLLTHFPQFDETPHITMPGKYTWPNAEGLYCKSYCPNHPDVHGVVFALVDELMEACDATTFHAGMDEVFYLAMDSCSRCSGLDPATLFAQEVNAINNHLAANGYNLWIWGDRLLDGKTTGIGLWEASMNNTARAIDLIAKEVVICDWHYKKAYPTPVLFAMKGLAVVACPWNQPEVMEEQFKNHFIYRKNASETLKSRYLGVMQTVWAGAGPFMDSYYTAGLNELGDSRSLKKFMGLLDMLK